MLHIFDKSTGQYASYELKASTSASALDESGVSECRSFRICGAAGGSEEYKVTLVYSNAAAETGEVDRYLGVAHASVSLHSIGSVIPPRCFLGASVLPRRLQSELQVSVTLALTQEQTVLLLIGGQVVSETPLQWGDDLVDLEDDEATAGRGFTGSSFGTLFSGGPHVSVGTQVTYSAFMYCASQRESEFSSHGTMLVSILYRRERAFCSCRPYSHSRLRAQPGSTGPACWRMRPQRWCTPCWI
jgi:hypothetical protein